MKPSLSIYFKVEERNLAVVERLRINMTPELLHTVKPIRARRARTTHESFVQQRCFGRDVCIRGAMPIFIKEERAWKRCSRNLNSYGLVSVVGLAHYHAFSHGQINGWRRRHGMGVSAMIEPSLLRRSGRILGHEKGRIGDCAVRSTDNQDLGTTRALRIVVDEIGVELIMVRAGVETGTRGRKNDSGWMRQERRMGRVAR